MALKFASVLVIVVLAACSNPKRDRQNAPDTVVQPSLPETTKQPDTFALDTSTRNQAAVKDVLDGLPDLMEGDIIVQDIKSMNGELMLDAMGGSWSNIGIIFRREADGAMVVMDAANKVRITPLPEWISAGKGQQLALYRLKNGEELLVPRNVTKLRAACKPFKAKSSDLYLNWSDDEMYSGELVWKVYQNGLGISLCPPDKLASLKLTNEALKPYITKKYGTTVPSTELAVTIKAICSSPQLKLLYAR